MDLKGLRCYACDGFGVDDACMIEPVNVSRIATCEPNEFCHILRTVTMLNSTEEDDGPGINDVTGRTVPMNVLLTNIF